METNIGKLLFCSLADKTEFQKIAAESYALKIKFENYIFASVYYFNFYYNECALNYLGIKSNFYFLSNEIIRNQNIVRALKVLYKLTFIVQNKCLITNKAQLRNDYKLQLWQSHNKTNIKKNWSVLDLLVICCYLINDNDYLEKMNNILLDGFQTKNIKYNSVNNQSQTESCLDCFDLLNKLRMTDDQYQSLTKKYMMIQIEKEKTVMRYVKSEKQLIDSKRLMDDADKKMETVLKEQSELRQKYEKMNDKVRKLNAELQQKCSEIIELRNHTESFKATENNKEMKLTWAQNRLKFVSNAVEELKWKLKESSEKISELTSSKLEINGDERASLLRHNKIKSLDPNYNEENTNSESECGFKEHLEIADSDHQSSAELFLEEDNFNKMSVSNSEIEVAEHESFKDLSNKVLGEKSNDMINLEEQFFKESSPQQLLKSKTDYIQQIEFRILDLYVAIADQKSELDAHRSREVQTMEYIQKLTDENIRLLHENENLRIKSIAFEKKQIPLVKSLQQSKLEIEDVMSNLISEKSKRSEENRMISKLVAEQSYFNEKLLNEVEDLRGQNSILVKKYNFILKGMVTEMHSNHNSSQNVWIS